MIDNDHQTFSVVVVTVVVDFNHRPCLWQGGCFRGFGGTPRNCCK